MYHILKSVELLRYLNTYGKEIEGPNSDQLNNARLPGDLNNDQ